MNNIKTSQGLQDAAQPYYDPQPPPAAQHRQNLNSNPNPQFHSAALHYLQLAQKNDSLRNVPQQHKGVQSTPSKINQGGQNTSTKPPKRVNPQMGLISTFRQV